MDTELKNQFLREYFSNEVKIDPSVRGMFAKWCNNFHPENPKFMQNVYWVAYENGDRSKIIIRYSLDLQRTKMYDYKVIDNTGNFEETIFGIWKSQSDQSAKNFTL